MRYADDAGEANWPPTVMIVPYTVNCGPFCPVTVPGPAPLPYGATDTHHGLVSIEKQRKMETLGDTARQGWTRTCLPFPF